MVVGLGNSELHVFNFLIMDEYGYEICVILVVVVGDGKPIFVCIFAFDDGEVLGVVEGVDVDGVAVGVMELVVDLRDRSRLEVDEIDGGIGGVEHDDFLLAEHCEPADHEVVFVAVDELALGVEVHDGLRLARTHHRREDDAAVVGGGEGGDLADGEAEVNFGPILQYHGLKYNYLTRALLNLIHTSIKCHFRHYQFFFSFLRRM